MFVKKNTIPFLEIKRNQKHETVSSKRKETKKISPEKKRKKETVSPFLAKWFRRLPRFAKRKRNEKN